jgi:predicted nucleic acid-binding protein
VQAQLFAPEDAIPFDARTAAIAAELYRRVARPRGREIDLAIAACALAHDATLWTLNRADFADIPGLSLYEPA